VFGAHQRAICALMDAIGSREIAAGVRPAHGQRKEQSHAIPKVYAAIEACAFLPAYVAIAPARANEVKAGDIVISQAWSSTTPKGAETGGGYLTIENKGSAPDRLIGGSTDVAGSVQIHGMPTEGGVMRMRPVENGVTIEPGKMVKLAPGGYHLMMMDLKQPLQRGDKVPVTLEFEKAGRVTISLDVEAVGAQGPAGGSRLKYGRQDADEEDARSIRHENVRTRRPNRLHQ
jgi:periplasmic copper chaperone A